MDTMISEMEIGLETPGCFSSSGSQSSSILTNHLHPHTDPTFLCNCQLEPLGSATVPPAGCSEASSLSSSSSLKSRGVGSQGLLSQTSFHTDEEAGPEAVQSYNQSWNTKIHAQSTVCYSRNSLHTVFFTVGWDPSCTLKNIQ